MSPLPAGAPLSVGTLLQGNRPGPITHLQSLGNLFRGDTAVRSFRCHLSSDLQRLSLSPEWIRAVTSKPTPHPPSPPEHPSPWTPGPRAASHQPHTASESRDLNSRLVSASPKQRGCVYSPYSFLPAQKGLCSTAHPRGCTGSSGLEHKAYQREERGQHVLASSPSEPQFPSCSTKKDGS